MEHNPKELRENILIESVYTCVNNNITEISEKYENILNPENNSLTRQYLNDNNDMDDAYAKSFATLLLFYKNLKI